MERNPYETPDAAPPAGSTPAPGSFIQRSWRGQEPLWKVFWLYNFLLGSLLNAGLDMALDSDNAAAAILASVVYVPYAIWMLVAMWRCAFNATWNIWGYLVRGLYVLMLIGALVFVFGLVSEN